MGGTASKKAGTFYLGEDMVFGSKKGGVVRFTIDGEVQTKEAFDRQIKSRFGEANAAWREALSYVKSFDKEVLLPSVPLFGEVYRPKRDSLAEKWTEASQTEEERATRQT